MDHRVGRRAPQPAHYGFSDLAKTLPWQSISTPSWDAGGSNATGKSSSRSLGWAITRAAIGKACIITPVRVWARMDS